MSPPTSSSMSPRAEKSADTSPSAQHLIIVQDPSAPTDQAARRLARSHAVRRGIQQKRKLQREQSQNFVLVTPQPKPAPKRNRATKASKSRNDTPHPTLILPPSNGSIDPFQTLAVDSLRLQNLLSDGRARTAPEPVFSVAQEFSFQSFRSVFRGSGLVDPALLSATMLSLATALGGGNNKRECLGYQLQAIGHVRERMAKVEEAASESTIGAILLLAGVEARLGMTAQVQLHMGAVKQLLDLCQKLNIRLTSGIRRAIFWQDLNSAILAKTTRIVDHTTFSELNWTRDSLPQCFFRLPPGFHSMDDHFSDDFVEILKDVNALCCVREYEHCKSMKGMAMEHLNIHTGSVQSRILGLKETGSPMERACRLAAYISSFMLCCTVWCSLVIPPFLSLQLLEELRKSQDSEAWLEHRELHVWLLCIGGAFASTGAARSDYVRLLRSTHVAEKTWKDVHEILIKFVWSDKAYLARTRQLWEEVVLVPL